MKRFLVVLVCLGAVTSLWAMGAKDPGSTQKLELKMGLVANASKIGRAHV